MRPSPRGTCEGHRGVLRLRRTFACDADDSLVVFAKPELSDANRIAAVHQARSRRPAGLRAAQAVPALCLCGIQRLVGLAIKVFEGLSAAPFENAGREGVF